MGGYFLRSCDLDDVISNFSSSVHFLSLSTQALIHSRDKHRYSRRLANCVAVSSIPPLAKLCHFARKKLKRVWVLLRRGSLDDLPPGLLFGQATWARTSGYLGMDGRFNRSPSQLFLHSRSHNPAHSLLRSFTSVL